MVQDVPFMETGLPGNGARASFSLAGEVIASIEAPMIRAWIYDPVSKKAIFPNEEGSSFSLEEGYLPIPRIRWKMADPCEAEMELIPLLSGNAPPQADAETFYSLNFRFFNPGSDQRNFRLLLAFCPHDRMGAASGKAIRIEGLNVTVGGKIAVRFPKAPDYVAYGRVEDPGNGTHDPWQPTAPEGAPGNSMVCCGFDLALKPVSGRFAHAAPCAELGFVAAAVPGIDFPTFEEAASRARHTRIFWKYDSGVGRPAFQVPHRGFCDAFYCAVSTLMLAWHGRESDATTLTAGDLSMAIMALNRAGQFEAARGIADQLIARQKQNRLAIREESAVRSRGMTLYAMDDLFRFAEDKARLDAAYPELKAMADALLQSARAPAESNETEPLPRLFPHLFETNWAIHGLNAAAHLMTLAGNAPLGREYETTARVLNTRLRTRFEEAVQENRLSLFITREDSVSPHVLYAGLSSLLFPEPLLDPRWSHVIKLYEQVLGLNGRTSNDLAVEAGDLLYEPIELALSMVRLHQSEWILGRLQELIDAPLMRGAWFWPEERAGKTKPLDPRRNLMPSCRVAAAYVVAFRTLFIQENDETIILAQGLPEKWYDYQPTVGIAKAPTRFGPVSYSLFCEGVHSELRLDSTASPPRGFALVPVGAPVQPKEVHIDGKRLVADFNFKRTRQVPFPAGTENVSMQW